jgi:hypothetical protein
MLVFISGMFIAGIAGMKYTTVTCASFTGEPSASFSDTSTVF